MTLNVVHRSANRLCNGFARRIRDTLLHAFFVSVTGRYHEKANAKMRVVFGNFISASDMGVSFSMSRSCPSTTKDNWWRWSAISARGGG